MVVLTNPVSSVPKIGPKYRKLLEKLEIYTVEDLMYHFPFRYDDLSNIKDVSDLVAGEVATIKGLLESVNNIYTKNGKKLTVAKIQDSSGVTQAIWFNQHYLKKSLQVGDTYQFSGKVDTFSNKICLIAPEIEKSEHPIHTGRLVPVYPETLGISSKYLRSRINDVLLRDSKFEEFLPEMLLNKRNLNEFDKAVRSIHFPNTDADSKHARHRFEFEEFFLELLKVEIRKDAWERKLMGIPFDEKKIKGAVVDFIKTLPFTLTDSQEAAYQEILKDMTYKHPMNRLLEGDVGTGKTVVAVIASYFTKLNGYKTIYMAPTEILANQHYETFKKFLEPLGLKVFLITGNKKEAGDNWDVLIGTHALLYGDRNYSNTGLIVIDEQHRFGVEQRAKLLETAGKKSIPHLLTMTATPIPRTLALTLFGDLSISTLRTPPNIGKKITTKVLSDKQRIEAYEHIRDRGESTFIVCPLIEESESISLENVKAAEVEFLSLKSGVFSGTSIGLLHGRMKPKEKQEVMDKFKSGEIKVLVSTPVIEVGIDVPEATVMVIESAERYGLASLHQLRGRVGRGDKPGVCLLFVSNNSVKSHERLKNMEKISNGLELAEIDMRLRGQGDVYGTMQHGFKSFKVADINNLEMLTQAKEDAQEIFQELGKYPHLKEKLIQKSGKLVGQN